MRMRKQAAALCALALAAVIPAACANDSGFSASEELSAGYERSISAEESYNYADGATEPPAAYNNYAGLVSNLELKLFRRAYAAAPTADFGFSPTGTALNLSLLQNGASGGTAQDLSLALGASLDADTFNACSSYFKSRLLTVNGIGLGVRDELSGKETAADPEVYLTLDNVLLIDDDTDVRTPFLQKNADYYGADIFRFALDSDSAAQKLAARYGDGFAPDLTDARDNTLLLCSQTAIGDRWLSGGSTASGTFTDASGEASQATYLLSQESYLHTETAEGVIKYTSKNPLKVVYVLPKEGTVLDEYIKRFDSVELDALLTSMDVRETVEVQIPAVTCQTPDAALTQSVQDCGLSSLFNEKADFGSLAHTDGLRVGAAYDFSPALRLDASGISSGKPAAEKADEGEMQDAALVFNRPFLFLILDNESNIPIYIGVKS